MRERLYRKKINYIGQTREYLKKRKMPLYNYEITWILQRFFFYVAKSLTHGYTVAIHRVVNFSLYHESTIDFDRMTKEARYCQSPAVHGVYFSIKCEGMITEKFNADFKPLLSFRRMIEQELDDPDLAYKLIKT